MAKVAGRGTQSQVRERMLHHDDPSLGLAVLFLHIFEEPVVTTESESQVPPVNSELIVVGPPQRSAWQRLARFLYNHNPFYLLSVASVLHGTAHWLRVEGTLAASPWLLMGLIGGYIVTLAFVGWLIVRFGKVWDDARSVLLTIPLLFVELSLAFDETLLQHVATGQLLLLTGFLGAVIVSEALLIGLRIRLPWQYRVPYYSTLALLFFYPMSLASLEVIGNPASYSWRIFLFPLFASVIALMLLPAVWRGARYVAENGTPWRWPLYPWSLFVILLVCVCFRAYALCLSFDPVLSLNPAAADRLENAFGAFYLIPLVLACGVLLLEGGVVGGNRITQYCAMLVPIIAVMMASPATVAPAPYFEFLQRFVHTIGSPMWLTVLASCVFYSWAWRRGIPGAEFGWLASMVLASAVGTQTMAIEHPQLVHVWPWCVIAAVELVVGLRRNSSWRSVWAIVGIILMADTQWFSREFARDPEFVRWGADGVVLLALLLWNGRQFRDPFAKFCERLGVGLLMTESLCGLGWTLTNFRDPTWTPTIALLFLTGLCVGFQRLTGQRDYQFASRWHLGLTLIAVYWQVDLLLRVSPYRIAILSFGLAVGWLLVAVFISMSKAGWLHRLKLLLPVASSAK